MNPEIRAANRNTIVQLLRDGVPILDIANQYHMTEHELRCILRAMNAIATLKRGNS